MVVIGAALLAAGSLGAQTDKEAPIDPANYPEGTAEFAALSRAAKYLED